MSNLLDVTCKHHRDIRNCNVYIFVIFAPNFTFPIAMARYCHQIKSRDQFFTQLPTCCFMCQEMFHFIRVVNNKCTILLPPLVLDQNH